MDAWNESLRCNSSVERSKEYYSIGELSKICNIPIKTLRYYDEIGVLKPDKICKENSYRFYEKSKVQQFQMIRYYKSLGFKLDIIRVMQARADIPHLKNILQERLSTIRENINQLQKEYWGVLEWYELLQEGSSYLSSEVESLDIQVKTIPLCKVITMKYVVRDKLSDSERLINFTFSNYCNYCREHNLVPYGPILSRFAAYQDRINDTFNELEYYIAVREYTQSENLINNFGGLSAVAAIHKGSYATISKSYTAILDRLSELGLTIRGDAFEKYIIDPWSTVEPDNFVTEIIFPLA
jgi:DNA-binding transcriptional MerR regulator